MSLRIVLNFALLSGFALTSLAQQVESSRRKLEELRIESDSIYKAQNARAKEYATKRGIPLSYRDSNDNFVLLVDVSDSGVPIYKSTDNAGAAITTGVVKLRENGGLGLNLTGNNLMVGVWDGGIVKDHIEFGSRILSKQGTAEDNHATHVTGTILAAGVNPSAMGMATKARASTFDFNNDQSEMLLLARSDQSTILLSNHSYGVISGWRFNNGWSWFGDAGVSNQEDYKFGYYSNSAKSYDQIAYNAPYYTICKSAGNDRSDTGTGTPPADCNGGTGYDCISDVSTAKNIITIGAVSKIAEYTSPSSVIMSSFSSWGPTDDGRIKPDFVAAGVNLFSTSSAGNDQYTQLSGTSMSTPNTTGSLLLLQELYRDLNGGNFMRSSMLKALAIHSTKEAGSSLGPDYSNGWGLLDVEAAAKLILAQDQQNVFITDYVLQNNQKFELVLNPKAGEKITATIVWTDVPGTPPPVSLDPQNIMLVNDLDLRIVDDSGTEQLPWILDPGNPFAPAAKGDNIRDNVEKIEFESPEPRSYKLIVKHKGLLNTGQQSFSLIVNYKSVIDPLKKYYWVGNSGIWNDPSHWSLESGGPAANLVPTIADRVIFDENSFSASGGYVELDDNASCYSVTWLEKQSTGISLNGKTLTIDENLINTSKDFSILTAGSIKLIGFVSKQNLINAGEGDFSKASITIDGAGAFWKVNGKLNLDTLQVNAGSLDFSNSVTSIKKVYSTSSFARLIDFSGTTINNLTDLNLRGANLQLISTGSSINLVDESTSDPTVLNCQGLYLESDVNASSSSLRFEGSAKYKSVVIQGIATVLGSNEFVKFKLLAGSKLNLANGTQQTMGADTQILSTSNNPTEIESSGQAALFFEGHYKLCFDFLKISNVNSTGSAVINAGINSVITNSSNWGTFSCDDVLFPDFVFQYNCQGALTQFQDKSSGKIDSWEWDFGDASSKGNTRNPFHIYNSIGTFSTTLVVSKGQNKKSYTAIVQIAANNLPPNQIILDNGNFFSFNSSGKYQWYKNEELIVGANQRSYKWDGSPASYFVATFSDNCNIPSNSYVITGLNEDITPSIYPNPSAGKIKIEMPDTYIPYNLSLHNSMGLKVYEQQVFSQDVEVYLGDLAKGIYFAILSSKKIKATRKIIIK